ncbi:hypothetical protein GCM10025786_23810 [Nocardioides caeni]
MLMVAGLLAGGEAGATAQEGEAVTARAAARALACARPSRSFVPDRARVTPIGRVLPVRRVARTASGAIGAPPLTRAGKWMVGMDPEVRPGSGRGSVILVAHTYPDGSALGNRLLRQTRAGHSIVLRNAAGTKACYRISERRSYRADRVPRDRAFRSWGPEQVVIVVCSGRRLGPGRWSHRTLWYAVPATR